MGQWIPLDTPAGRVAAWLAEPAGAARGGLVVVQEIFGANAHIRAVAEGYAADGYVVLAPAFFDPVEPGVELTTTRPAPHAAANWSPSWAWTPRCRSWQRRRPGCRPAWPGAVSPTRWAP